MRKKLVVHFLAILGSFACQTAHQIPLSEKKPQLVHNPRSLVEGEMPYRPKFRGSDEMGKRECNFGASTAKPYSVIGTTQHGFALSKKTDAGPEEKIIIPEPSSNFEIKGEGATGRKFGSIESRLACDFEGQRFFGSQAIHGYVLAFNPEGQELWRFWLPKFDSLFPDLQNGMDPINLRKATLSHGSTIGLLVFGGSRLAVMVYEREKAILFIFHRSGVLLGQTEAWDGFPVEGDEKGWKVVFGGIETNQDLFLPSKAGFLPWPQEAEIDLQIEHFFASLLPKPGQSNFSWCEYPVYVPAIKARLGNRFSPEVALMVERARAKLGKKWFEDLANLRGLGSYFWDPKPMDPEWEAAVRKALFRTGADVDFMKALQSSSPH